MTSLDSFWGFHHWEGECIMIWTENFHFCISTGERKKVLACLKYPYQSSVFRTRNNIEAAHFNYLSCTLYWGFLIFILWNPCKWALLKKSAFIEGVRNDKGKKSHMVQLLQILQKNYLLTFLKTLITKWQCSDQVPPKKGFLFVYWKKFFVRREMIMFRQTLL